MKWYHFLLLFVQGMCFSLILTPLMRQLAPKLGFLDQPNARKVHYHPKPLLGGAAIYFAFILVVLGNLFLLTLIFKSDIVPNSEILMQVKVLAMYASGAPLVVRELIGVLFGGTLLFIVGLWDDRHGMSPLVKLSAQIAAAIILYFSKVEIALFIQQPIINFGLTVFWIVLITNSFNLLDNMDGLSGGVAMIALILLGIAASLVSEQAFMSSISFALAGCIAGFLRYNLNPSTIFMGDAGSLFIGYTVAALTVQSTFYVGGENATSWSVVMPIVILAVPMFDTLSVITIRVANGKPIYLGDKNHFSHRLVALGMSHRRAVFFIHLVTLCVGSNALILPFLSNPFGAYIILTQTIIYFILIAMLEYIKKTNGVK